jgi:DNA replication and repair protein RecF
MRLSRIQLQYYRNILELDLELHPELTVFLGPNGSGKTNVLEAISLLSLPRSFRAAKDAELIAWEHDFARVDGQVETGGSQSDELSLFIDKKKHLFINSRPVKASEFIGTFWTILFSPEDVDLLAASPGKRRAFFDAYLSIVVPHYFENLVMYQRILTQRNKLLSRPTTMIDEFDYWNTEQVRYGSFLLAERVHFALSLQEYLPKAYEFTFLPNIHISDNSIESAFQEKQANMFYREKQIGYSLVGPQRDDFRLYERLPVRRDIGIFGSRGDQRMAVISLKLAQLELMQKIRSSKAVLLLDDVLSELDVRNQELLFEAITKRQSILTTASLADISPTLLKDALVYEVKNGSWNKV